jgi:hypothetical protein
MQGPSPTFPGVTVPGGVGPGKDNGAVVKITSSANPNVGKSFSIASFASPDPKNGVKITDPGYCTSFARQLKEMEVGVGAGGLSGTWFKGNARQTWENFEAKGAIVARPGSVAQLQNTLKPGDIVFQDWGNDAQNHVGYYVGNGMIAHNAVVLFSNSKRVEGAIQYTPVGDFFRTNQQVMVGRIPTKK